MYVVLRVIGWVALHHTGHVVNVDAAGCHVSCHQHVRCAVAEILEGLLTLGLRTVAMDNCAANTEGLELAGKTVRAVLGAAESNQAAMLSNE